jgi:hypothetical protein
LLLLILCVGWLSSGWHGHGTRMRENNDHSFGYQSVPVDGAPCYCEGIMSLWIIDMDSGLDG